MSVACLKKQKKNVYEIFQNKKADIILLQKAHSTKETVNKCQIEWKAVSIWQSGKIPKSSGIAIHKKTSISQR